jgi:hypothetical protein
LLDAGEGELGDKMKQKAIIGEMTPLMGEFTKLANEVQSLGRKMESLGAKIAEAEADAIKYRLAKDAATSRTTRLGRMRRSWEVWDSDRSK